jgi:hypothetical protein
MKKPLSLPQFISLLLFILPVLVLPNVKLPVLLSDSMVRQRDSKIIFLPKKAGGPDTMEVKGNNNIRVNDILAGDVWFCSGQSNMELNMKRVIELIIFICKI